MSSEIVPSAAFTEAWCPGFDGTKFYTRTWAADSPKAVAIFLHGFADHVARYDGVHTTWASRNITVFAYDQRGFGRTALDEVNKSPASAYGKTNTAYELQDIEFWINYTSAKYPALPLFLIGYSAGGAAILTFVSRTEAPPKSETIAKISGVICASPLITLVHPPSAVARTIGGFLCKVAPNIIIPAPVPAERFSRSPEVVKAIESDNWRRPEGTLRGVDDMLNRGIANLKSDWKTWPKDLPILIVHGGADEVNALKGSQSFIDLLSNTTDKKLVVIPNGLHDLYHEIDSIPQRVTDEYISWIEAHL
ncbi:lysophospholipase [Phanerochaete sordida]|uniref:Lysophospholipase n=1 Tax=Phanerochaete sordida TaxID=48140 RepID=A0A9P3G615_9APHY|nr:lysophospholipase [Phanerochaete sordida]